MFNLFSKKTFAKAKSKYAFYKLQIANCKWLIIFCILLIANCTLPTATQAQTTQTITYTTKDGLPSNSVYKTIIDQKGYLWIATETGLARFDGKKFKTYSTKDGLTDNEIIELFTDSSGLLWVFPFRHSPCYYNAVADRFENNETDAELAKIELGNTHLPHLLKYGGVLFTNSQRNFFIYRDKKTTAYKNLSAIKKYEILRVVETKKNEFLFFSEDSIRFFKNGNFETKLAIGNRVLMTECVGQNVYVATPQSVLQFRFDDNGNTTLVKEKKYQFPLRVFCYTSKHFSITSVSGTTYLLDNTTLEPTAIISAAEGLPTRRVLEDKDGNTWLSTNNNGLIKVQNKRISFLDVKELKQNFNTLIANKNIIAGNNNGELLSYDGLYVKKLLLSPDKNMDAWVRKIIKTPYGIFVATQAGSFLIDEKSFAIKKSFLGADNRSTKAANIINDSILLLGGHAVACQYNLKTQKLTDSILKRVTALGSDLFNNIYIGSTEGLYLWKQKQLINLGEQTKGLSKKINAITSTIDSMLWVGTGIDSLMVLKNNKLIARIPLGDIIPGSICKSLYSNKKGEIWLGTNNGLNRIYYTYANNQLSYYNTYFGTTDGLIGEQVNDIVIKDTTVYVATNDGISFLPDNLKLPISDIPVFITGVAINGVPIDLKNEYDLKYSENDVTIDFSGVDLTGFLPLFEYSNNNEPWKRTEKIELKRLAPGSYNIKIRAIRRDGKPSASIASITIKIGTPFWKNSIFWTLFAFGAFGFILYIQQRRNKQKQKIAVEKVTTEKRLTELEMQALKAQINPHFVFNCLNSIKGFIYDKDYVQADKYLDKFSELMRTTIDNSDASIISLKDEISYLDNYLQLEKLRFDERFDYTIKADETINEDAVFVPAMLLQPYVENAIRHGIRFLENKKGLISIGITQQNNQLVCTIDDNGIGREKATLLKSKMHIEYQSKGMSISKRRADLYNIEQQIIDKKDENGIAAGTKIIIQIPLNLKP